LFDHRGGDCGFFSRRTMSWRLSGLLILFVSVVLGRRGIVVFLIVGCVHFALLGSQSLKGFGGEAC
jgi:hypothetical protein